MFKLENSVRKKQTYYFKSTEESPVETAIFAPNFKSCSPETIATFLPKMC